MCIEAKSESLSAANSLKNIINTHPVTRRPAMSKFVIKTQMRVKKRIGKDKRGGSEGQTSSKKGRRIIE